MKLKLPKEYRPDNVYRTCDLGTDLPRAFVDDLQAIDRFLYPVFHPYRVLWDDIMNMDSGQVEDPRNTVHMEGSEMVFGFVLTDGAGKPLEDGTWHIWRWCYPHGVAHVVQLKDRDPNYLRLILKRIYTQATWTNKYGFKSYNRLLSEIEEKDREQMMKDREELFNATHEENEWLLRKAMANFDSGITAPTNPKKETIMGYGGQSNHSRIVRPLDDEDVLITPGS